MYVYTYVRMYVYMYVCMHVCMYECTYVCMYTYMYVRTYVCMYVHMYIRMYICMYVCTYVCMYVCMFIRMFLMCEMAKWKQSGAMVGGLNPCRVVGVMTSFYILPNSLHFSHFTWWWTHYNILPNSHQDFPLSIHPYLHMYVWMDMAVDMYCRTWLQMYV